MSENHSDTSYAVTQEVRIASVMFGGVSLAIYMNGITQELLRAVRATAPGAVGTLSKEWTALNWGTRRTAEALLSDRQLQSTESIYRILGRSLFHGRAAGTRLTFTGPIRTRIVIDLLAGTSAGGINSVYLAKALVNNQNLDELKQMWMDQADIDTLLNDGGSDPASFPPGPKTTSLLNSTRMYGLLYRAFENMDVKQRIGTPLADEVDLFVTTTDLDGVATPIQLADRMIEERVHKASFHFVYGPGRPGRPNDFTETYNPMLAFASRCTSSFPIAFEPMTLEHVDRRIPGLALAIQQNPDHALRKFFTQFERNNPGLSFVRRPLADGGYLNNKPFSFVIDQVKVRTGTVPVSRKLLFLDPFPELDSQVRHTKQDIDFVENALDAASTLPRYQTILEDIERLNEYNRAVHAAQCLAREIEDESPNLVRDYATGPNPDAYPRRTLSSLERQFGPCYRTYHRLRVSAVTTELASLVTRLLQQNDRSDSLCAIRMLIHAWRKENYSPEEQSGKALETFFLFQFDIGFRFRRTEYVRARIDALLAAMAAEEPDTQPRLDDLLRGILPKESQDSATAVAKVLRNSKEEATRELYRLRDQIEFVKWKLASERERIHIETSGRSLDGAAGTPRKRLIQALENTELTPDDLGWILTPVQDDQCQQRADILYRTGERREYDKGPRSAYSSQPGTASGPRPVKENIVSAAKYLAEWYSQMLGDLSKQFIEALDYKANPNFAASATEIVKEYVWTHYQYFDCRDMQVFTVMQDQLAGEGSAVEIYRISPLDAILLRTNSDPAGENKLAGTALFAFGAFLSKEWRRNDIMWGRLDGAERIIGALLPDESDGYLRRELCEQAFRIVIEEEFTPAKCADLIRPLMEYLRQRINPAGKTADQFLQEAMRNSEENCPEVVRQLLKSIAGSSERLSVFRAYYVKPADPPVDQSLDRLRRAIRIFRDMLKELDGGNGPFTSVGGTIANVGSALTRFAEFSIPQKLSNVFFRYGLQLLYTVALALIAAGALFYKEVETAGWVILLMTGGANIASWLVGKWLFRQKTERKIAAGLVAIVLLVVAVATLSVRLECYLPPGAWKAPLHSVAHLLDSRCVAGK
jgi:patatin-related protein